MGTFEGRGGGQFITNIDYKHGDGVTHVHTYCFGQVQPIIGAL